VNTNESQLSSNPVAVIGGLLGLLPFWGLAFADLWATGDWVFSVSAHLVNYAALILTFVGAIWWGIALNAPHGLFGLASRGFLFGWSLVPCLLAWFLLTLDRQMALVGFAALLVLQLLLDFIFLWRAQLIARWFWQLRVVLTIGAAPALLFAGFFE
jgi:Protein of unknown function (DUF3429)